MKTDSTLTGARNDAFRKIGRNVVLFQQLEVILKYLASAQQPSMPLSEAKRIREKREAGIRVKTLGQVAAQVVEQMLTPACENSSAPDEITEPWLSLSYRIEVDPIELERNLAALESLIKERNDLVHQLLSRWNLNDVDNCGLLSTELDRQRTRITAEIERYRAFATTVSESARELQVFVESDEGKRQFDVMFLQSSRLAMLLCQIASAHSRKDGWTLLSVAGAELSRLIPDDFARLKLEHGDGSLRRLLTAIDLFEIATEGTPNAGTRTVFRVRQ